MSEKLQKTYAWILTGGGLAGLVAMTWQAAERVAMLKNPTAPLNCNLSPILDCGTVLGNRLAALFGFPNAFIGIAIFAMLLLGGILLVTGNKPNQRFKGALFAVSTILFLFSVWFFGVSLYSIGKICIFCLVGWIVSLPIFIYGLLYWLDGMPNKQGWLRKVYNFVLKNHGNVLITGYVLMAMLYFLRFQDYYFG